MAENDRDTTFFHLEEALQLSLPAPFSEWGEEQAFRWNMETFFAHAKSTN